jgi:predicted glycogen debranching enzyme
MVQMHSVPLTEAAEWLEPDGLGGFASGTACGLRTRRYHSLLLTATSPPTGRVVLVNGFEAWVEDEHGRCALSTQRYAPDVVYPDGQTRLQSFTNEPWPTWKWRLENDQEVQLELFTPRDISACVLCFKLAKPNVSARLTMRPLLSGRDYHSLHHENPAFRFDADLKADTVTWKPYSDVPATVAISNGRYTQEPEWFRNFLYARERERGLDGTEDLASPGTFTWLLGGEAVLILVAEAHVARLRQASETAEKIVQNLRESERRRRESFAGRLERSADAYFVRRGTGKTLIAGYPWFTDWGRDTFISMRGLCLATRRFDEACDILTAWASTISEGMLPNRFPDSGETLEFNSVDASLWYIVAVHEYLEAVDQLRLPIASAVRDTLHHAVLEILAGYYHGTRYGILCDDNGLLAAGADGVSLTWMDARVDGQAVTARIGKPVEVEALWLTAVRIGAAFDPRWNSIYERGLAAFQTRFWSESRGCLFDVIDADHRQGATDDSLRPNQIFAVGGLPWPLLDEQRARQVVDAVEAQLWTPMGLRTLEPSAAAYRGTYVGSSRERDSAYHQGTVWPWLAGPFIEAWGRVRGNSAESREQARAQFLEPMLAHLDEGGLGHISEIADGDAPHAPRGCPFQAWSLAELIRIDKSVLADQSTDSSAARSS